MRVLVIDIGGTNVKVWTDAEEPAWKIETGPEFTPQLLADEVAAHAQDSQYDAISIGYPGKLIGGRPVRDPYQLGPGWVDFDYGAHFTKPLRLMNDAAMQALGAYRGGRMLFLGLGTCVGSTLIVDNVVIPLELGAIPHPFGKTLELRLERKALDKRGFDRWQECVLAAVPPLLDAFMVDYVVLGGGNAKKLKAELPENVRLGGNHDAHRGGHRLWESTELNTAHVYDHSIAVTAQEPMAGDRVNLAS
jgi:polyphosphate glucokinase